MSKRNWISLLISVLSAGGLLLFSYIIFLQVDYKDYSSIEEFIVFPITLAGAFAFGGGEFAMWIILFVELSILTLMFLPIAKLISNKKDRR